MGNLLLSLGVREGTVGAKKPPKTSRDPRLIKKHPYHPLVHSPIGIRSRETWANELIGLFDTGFDPSSPEFTDWLFDSLGYSRTHKRRLKKVIEAIPAGATQEALNLIWNGAMRGGYGETVHKRLEDVLDMFREYGYDIGSIDDWTAVTQDLISQDYKNYLLALKKLFPEWVPYPLREQIFQIWAIEDVPNEIWALLEGRFWQLMSMEIQEAGELAYRVFSSEMDEYGPKKTIY